MMRSVDRLPILGGCELGHGPPPAMMRKLPATDTGRVPRGDYLPGMRLPHHLNTFLLEAEGA